MIVTDVVLASRSPRRRELLRQLGLTYTVVDVEIDETPFCGEDPASYVRRMAATKAMQGYVGVADEQCPPVLGADTAVVVDDQILGKPVDLADALVQLELLSGRAHKVLCAVAIANLSPAVVCVASTVRFRATTAGEREAYCSTGEPFDKAGSYAIQGRAAVFIHHLEGSYSAVMGLPLFETSEMLAECGVRTL